MQEIRPEAVFLLADPCQRQAHGQIDLGSGQSPEAQLLGNGRQSQHIVVAVHHLVSGELLVPLANGVEMTVVDKQVVVECWFFLVGCYAGRKAGVGAFDIAVAVVNSENDCVVVHK